MEETGKSVQKCIGFDTEEVVAMTHVVDTLGGASTADVADIVKEAGTAAVKEADTAFVQDWQCYSEKTNHLRIVVANASAENCQTLGHTVYWDAQLSKSQTSHELPSSS